MTGDDARGWTEFMAAVPDWAQGCGTIWAILGLVAVALVGGLVLKIVKARRRGRLPP